MVQIRSPNTCANKKGNACAALPLDVVPVVKLALCVLVLHGGCAYGLLCPFV